MRLPIIAWCGLLSFVLLGAGCKKETPPPMPAPPPALGMSAYGLAQSRMIVGGRELVVEIALTPEEKAKGLSGRQSLAEGTGMLFVFDEPFTPSFWMPRMQFGLDILWIRDGTVIDISAQVPYPDPATPLAQLPTYSPRAPATHVLEVPAGWAERNQVTASSRVELPAVDQK